MSNISKTFIKKQYITCKHTLVKFIIGGKICQKNTPPALAECCQNVRMSTRSINASIGHPSAFEKLSR